MGITIIIGVVSLICFVGIANHWRMHPKSSKSNNVTINPYSLKK